MRAGAKVVWITGATSGIGLETARLLACEGYRVYGVGRRVGEASGEPFIELRCDINDQASVASCVASILEREGRLDVLVNCAGFAMGGGVEDTTVEEAKAQFETNLFGTHRVIRQVLPAMRRQGGGHIITVSSVASEFVVPFQGFYSISKMALDGLMLAVRMECGPHGIQACTVNPGDVRTGFTAARKQAAGITPASPYYAATLKSIQTMERDEQNGMAPEQVAEVIVRLVGRRKLPAKVFIETQYKAIMMLKRLLPLSWVEKLMLMVYG